VNIERAVHEPNEGVVNREKQQRPPAVLFPDEGRPQVSFDVHRVGNSNGFLASYMASQNELYFAK
jgi:hypothetical protein